MSNIPTYRLQSIAFSSGNTNHSQEAQHHQRVKQLVQVEHVREALEQKNFQKAMEELDKLTILLNPQQNPELGEPDFFSNGRNLLSPHLDPQHAARKLNYPEINQLTGYVSS